MDPAGLRDLCLNLPGATESFPFGPETPVYKAANGKVFAITTEPDDPAASFTAKADPEDAEALREEYAAITPGYHMNKRHWITVLLDGTVPDDLVVEIVAESHRLVAPRIRKARGARAAAPASTHEVPVAMTGTSCFLLRGQDLNLRPLGYEPSELPNCSTPRR